MNQEKNNPTYYQFANLTQFAIILAPFAFFFDAAYSFKGRMNLSSSVVMIILFVLNGGLLLLTVFACIHFSSYRKDLHANQPQDRGARRKRFLSCLPITVVATAFSCLAALQFDSIPRYDGGLYYSALISATETFTFTIDSLVSAFTIWLHPMQGTSLFIGTGEMLFPRQTVGVYGAALIITLAAIFCLYGIMGRCFPASALWLKAAGVAIFAFCPYVLGLFSHFSPDYFTLMFFVILIYLFSIEWDYLAAFVSLLLVFSREVGILFAAAFLVTAILIWAGKAEGTNYFTKLKRYLFPKRLILYSIAPLIFAYYAFIMKGLTFGEAITTKSSFRWDSKGEHCFGINPAYIIASLGQILYSNYFWVASALFIAAVFVYFFRKRKNENTYLLDKSADYSIIAGIALGSFSYILFSCLYITLMCPRYNVFFALPVSLVSVWAVSYIGKHKVVIKIIMGILVLLFLLQNYFDLDPSQYSGHEKINLGYRYIYSTSKYYRDNYVCEMYVHNHTYNYSEDLLDQALERINPDKNDSFMVIDGAWNELYLIGDPNATTHLIYWDPVHKKRTYDYKAEGAFIPKTFSIASLDIRSDKALDLPNDFYLILLARENEDVYVKALASKGYNAADSFTVKNYIGYLNIYHMYRSCYGSSFDISSLIRVK